MGVLVPFEDLRPKECVGSSYQGHCEVATAIEDQVVAIDASQAFEQGLQDSRDSVVDWRIDKEQVVQKHMQWVFQAYQGARSREAQVVLEFSEAIRLSAITLIMDRATQILRYGGHPVVVLDGKPPIEKARAAQWTGSGPFQIHGLIEQLCAAMGVCCVRAPGEGEAFCAALNEVGIADLCFTSDVIDIFFFGACKVIRSLTKAEHTKAKFLTYLDPVSSSFALVDRQKMISFIGEDVLQEHLKDVLLLFAAIVGTDYNSKGLSRFGKEKAKAMTRLIYKQWQGAHRPADGNRCFLDFSVSVVLGQVEIDCTADRSLKKFLEACAEETRPGVTFATDLQLVVKVVLDQRAKAREQAIAFKRTDVIWTGKTLHHGDLISILIQAKVDQEQENGVNGVLSRVMKIEAERMLRLGEASLVTPLLRISSIVKPKQVKKWMAGKEDGVSSNSQFYHYLVNVSLVVDCDIQDAQAKAKLLEYVRHGTTWSVSARAARASAIRMNWPAVLDAYNAKCSAKTKKSNKIATVVTGQGIKDSRKGKPRVATEGVGSVQNVRTSHGTHHIRSFFTNCEAPSRASMDMLVAHQRTKRSPAHKKSGFPDDASPVLQDQNTDHSSTQVPSGRLEHACCAGIVTTTSSKGSTCPTAAHVSPGSPEMTQTCSDRSQCTDIFSSMPDLIAKQPCVFLAGTPDSSPAQGRRQCLASRSPEKRDRSCIPGVVKSASRDEDLPTAAAIDLTISSDDDLPNGMGQISHDTELQKRIGHTTPQKRRSY